MSDLTLPTDKAGRQEQLSVLFTEAVPHNHALGLRLVDVGTTDATVVMPYADVLVGNPETGVVAGGAVTTLIDATCGTAVLARLGTFAAIVTLDLRIDYLRPARPGLELTAHAECYKVTRLIAFVRALVHQGDPEQPVASSQGTFMRVED
ncbi:PaaI family thioesterase [Corallococcus sp. bb12-1]|uniref:PaaI family thioesterase n=1 Tax=Corallococcus terminator TaxID=2316733 RepID=A0A3A8HBX5_9BACT|nr:MULTISPECIES: PaaI family thioesterase [Corallococcus]MCY1041188.1 PaaI family thioesterase [Corallococcus sp. bb12-1]RKG68218.1 PaaI family thioesterase [Corallococcus terminator]